jgi:hypothetical protein
MDAQPVDFQPEHPGGVSERHSGVTVRPGKAAKALNIPTPGCCRSKTGSKMTCDDPDGAGQSLVARFQAAGFTLGEKNRFATDCGLKILDAQGGEPFTQEEAASDEVEPFYPRRLLNGARTLSITEGVTPGDYLLEVTVTDDGGGKTAAAQGRFRVEK